MFSTVRHCDRWTFKTFSSPQTKAYGRFVLQEITIRNDVRSPFIRCDTVRRSQTIRWHFLIFPERLHSIDSELLDRVCTALVYEALRFIYYDRVRSTFCCYMKTSARATCGPGRCRRRWCFFRVLPSSPGHDKHPVFAQDVEEGTFRHL